MDAEERGAARRRKLPLRSLVLAFGGEALAKEGPQGGPAVRNQVLRREADLAGL